MKKFFSSALLAILITLLFFLPHLLKGRIPAPADSILNLYHPFRDLEIDGRSPGRFPAKNPFINDPVLQTYPWRNLVIKNFKMHEWPLWNPYSFSGTPLLANFQSAPFQILNILFLILPFKISWATAVIIPSLLLSLFMYLFLREIKISKAPSVFGAFVLPLSGFFMSWMTWGTITTTAMWLPLILVSILKLNSKISALWFLILTLSISQTIFSGHAQTSLYVVITAIIFIIYLYLQNHKSKQIAVSFLAIILGVSIASVQIFPTLEFVKLSARSVDQGYFNGRQDWFLPTKNLIQLISPDFFGNPATNNYWGVWNYWEFTSFIGIIPLSFAIFAIFKKSPHRLFFIAQATISLLLALSNPISKIPYTTNFLFVSTMQPSRIIFLFVFSLVTLSAIGIDDFIKEEKDKFIRRKTLFIFIPVLFLMVLVALMLSTFILKDLFPLVIGVNTPLVAQRNLIIPIATCVVLIMISLMFRFSVKKRMATVAIILIYLTTILELFRFGYKFTPFSKPSWIFPQTQIMTYLQNQERPFRVMTTDRRILHPNIAGVYNIESTDGYDPLFLGSYGKLVSVWQSNKPDQPLSSFNRIVTAQSISSPLVNLLNVKYVLTLDEIKNPDFIKIMHEGETKLYQNTRVWSRIFFANEIKKSANDQEELSMLLDKNLEQKSAVSQDFSFPKQNSNSSAKIEKYDDQSLTISTESDKSAPLVVTNPIYPGWRVYIDGQEKEIKKVDFMFQSTIVPQGTHTVEFKFEPQSFYNGLYLSALATAAAALVAFFIWRNKYQS